GRLLLRARPPAWAPPRLLLRLRLGRGVFRSRLRLRLLRRRLGGSLDSRGFGLLLFLRPPGRGLPRRLLGLAFGSDRLGNRLRLRDERGVGGSVAESFDPHPARLTPPPPPAAAPHGVPLPH